MDTVQFTEHIIRIRVPFLDVTTSVFLVKTPKGNLLFDTATYPTDITDLILPALASLGVDGTALSHVFVSHPHRDHAGGLEALLANCPHLNVVAGSDALRASCGAARYTVPRDGDTLLDVLRVVFLPGHTADSIALLDTRTNTLLSGDGLQLYGLFGSGVWGANIVCPSAHLDALDRLAHMELAAIYPAHDYHPCGDAYVGRAAILAALDACRAALLSIRERILADRGATDEALADAYNEQALPTVGAHLFAAVRRELT